MASRWNVQKRGTMSLAFGELVSLARSCELTEDDLVKADWDLEWRPAHSVVGLFHHVRRTELEQCVEPSAASPSANESTDFSACRFPIDELAADLLLETAGESEAVPTAAPRWMQRYRDVSEQRAALASHASLNRAADPSSIQIFVDAAIQSQDRRTTLHDRMSRWVGRWKRLREFSRSPIAIRMTCGILLALLVCVTVASWSRQAALRFPKPGLPDGFLVPLLGDCTPREFLIVLIDLAVLSVIVGYLSAKRLET